MSTALYGKRLYYRHVCHLSRFAYKGLPFLAIAASTDNDCCPQEMILLISGFHQPLTALI